MTFFSRKNEFEADAFSCNLGFVCLCDEKEEGIKSVFVIFKNMLIGYGKSLQTSLIKLSIENLSSLKNDPLYSKSFLFYKMLR